MANSVGPIGAMIATKYAIAVAGKEKQQQADSAQQSLALIESAGAPQLATSGTLGTKLNFVA